MKNPHADPGFINHALQYMPGVDMSCRGWCRGFARHGQREPGFSLEEIKLILDHSEGAPAGDVTAGNYAIDPMIAKKRGIMVKWIDWLEQQVQQAIQQDPRQDRAIDGKHDVFEAWPGARDHVGICDVLLENCWSDSMSIGGRDAPRYRH